MSDDSLDLSAISADLMAGRGQGDPGDIFGEGAPKEKTMAELLAEAGSKLKKAPVPEKEKTMAELLAEAGSKLKKAPTFQPEPIKRALTFAEQLQEAQSKMKKTPTKEELANPKPKPAPVVEEEVKVMEIAEMEVIEEDDDEDIRDSVRKAKPMAYSVLEKPTAPITSASSVPQRPVATVNQSQRVANLASKSLAAPKLERR
jgi:hypothetical protein